MNISNNSYVEIHYALYDESNEVVDGSRGGEPLPYIQGKGNIIPGLEQALAGRAEGEKFTVTIEPAQGYGERDVEKVSIIDRESFAGFDSIEVGMLCQIEAENGEPQLVTLIAIDEEEVTIDANHPFAGQTLNFEVEVMTVREATEAELRDGIVG
ncbi:FKBP-type peptidyl-prolyl cis-trans isomerase [Amphritea balenae]|uniref:Peptidyl-prolyl cis-trans isomerase n=1 Tax=Amphritea balenae TaxID=452629 RepID=A0A3P1SRM4_9GAMM|nr:peptidylprolyl isomerase [Amphritea balenae]RRC99699.1 peptidylprolyl isomerase [Amphritea balenae]GGK79093.1 peptidyl-prolyl cis-trans isomerase [Amphritea balenae]